VESTLEHAVEAGLIALQQRKFRRRRKFAEGTGDAAKGTRIGLPLHSLTEKIVFDCPRAAHAPIRGGHFLEEAEFEFVHGFEPLDVLRPELFKSIFRFARQDDALREQSVGESIAGGAAFAFGRDRAARAGAISPRSIDSALRTHS
jgi:hypothetical protein